MTTDIRIKNIEEVNKGFREVVVDWFERIDSFIEIEKGLNRYFDKDKIKDKENRIEEANELIKLCRAKRVITIADLTCGYVKLKSEFEDDLYQLIYFLKSKLEN